MSEPSTALDVVEAGAPPVTVPSELAHPPVPYQTAVANLAAKLAYAEQVALSGLVPDSLIVRDKGLVDLERTRANVFLVMEWGQVLDLHPVAALQEVHVVKGKVGCSAKLMRAQVRRAGHDFRILENTPQRATVQVVLVDSRSSVPFSFSVEDAARAKLCSIAQDGTVRARTQGGDVKPWEAHTATMLLERATSAAVRGTCPEVLLGAAYTPEELDSMVQDWDGPAQLSRSAVVETRVRQDTDAVTKDDVEYLRTVMADLTEDERASVKAEREALGLSIEWGSFTVGTLRWILRAAQARLDLRAKKAEALGQAGIETTGEIGPEHPDHPMHGLPSTTGAAPAQPSRRQGAKLATKTERDAVAKKLAEVDPEVRDAVEQWAASNGHALGDMLAATSYQAVMNAIVNQGRAKRLRDQQAAKAQEQPAPEEEAPEPPADPDVERRALRRQQWATLSGTAETLGADETWSMIRQELAEVELAALDVPAAQVALLFCAAGADRDEWIADMVETYRQAADEFLGRPFTEGDPDEQPAEPAPSTLDDVDY